LPAGKVYSINENPWSGGWGSYWGSRGAMGGQQQNAMQSAEPSPDMTGSTLSVGPVSVSATVNVSFLIE
jgi:hypothetical protein